MTILFESQMYPEELEGIFVANSKVTLDFAANNFCKAITEGIKANGPDLRLVNLPNLGSFPSLYKKPWVKGCNFSDGVSISYCNISYLKRFHIKNRLYRAIKAELSSKVKRDDLVLLLYNFQCLSILKTLKRQFPQMKVCLIVTDLPEYMAKPNSKLYNLGKEIITRNKQSYDIDLSDIDGLVLLAPKMSEKLNMGEKPWIQMEGIYETGTETEEKQKESGKVILYTGNLGERYGVLNLLDAFAGIDGDDYKLCFRGSGDCQNEILERSKSDKRIILLPPLSRKDLLRLQKSATVLVNPVSPSEVFTNYFFPSKTLEYLASGTPVIMYHLNCLPKEYDKHIYYIEEDSVEGLRNKLIEVCNKPIDELRKFGEDASKFIYDNKTPKPQMKKVIDFIKSL